ncbi:hypothetical protein BV898_05812 [Hypsibius exemplaris]|uniref:Uncharacterized protein n=1 Tax=Hypsibius exemplaris TaxID=2072580 RepID=A0A1W0WYI0_HYPEX|nr:hypothetical protein BV898_05812 [Hypsibius exemplaris]
MSFGLRSSYAWKLMSVSHTHADVEDWSTETAIMEAGAAAAKAETHKINHYNVLTGRFSFSPMDFETLVPAGAATKRPILRLVGWTISTLFLT